jgi:hypothetical protein
MRALTWSALGMPLRASFFPILHYECVYRQRDSPLFSPAHRNRSIVRIGLPAREHTGSMRKHQGRPCEPRPVRLYAVAPIRSMGPARAASSRSWGSTEGAGTLPFARLNGARSSMDRCRWSRKAPRPARGYAGAPKALAAMGAGRAKSPARDSAQDRTGVSEFRVRCLLERSMPNRGIARVPFA